MRASERERESERVSQGESESDPENEARLRREGKDREPRLPKVKSRALFLSLKIEGKEEGGKKGAKRRVGFEL